MVVDGSLIARVEAAIVAERSGFAEGMARHRPETGAQWLAVAGGRAIFTGAGFFSNRVFGMGAGQPVAAEDIAVVERFYAARSLPAQIEIPSTAARPFLHLLAESGYRVVRLHNVYARPVCAGAGDPPAGHGVTIDAVSDAAAVEAWSDVLLDGFGYTAAADRERVAVWNHMLHSLASATALVAAVDGRPVGGASVMVSGATALLGGAATLPAFRRRGVQRALIEARVAVAARAGCDLAIVTADPGSSSGRNAERAGFRLVGVHLALGRRDGGPPAGR